MIFITQKKLFFILLLPFIFILSSAIWSYNVGSLSGIKSNSELILFLGFIIAGLQLIFSFFLLSNSKKKKKDFFALMKIIKSGGVFSEKKAKKMGFIGTELKEALKAAHDITTKKSLKIASLNGLLKMLLEFIQAPILLVNLNGEILEATPLAKEKIKFSQDLRLCDCLPNLSIHEAFKEASSTHSTVDQQGQIFHPVFSTIGDISYFLVDISKENSLMKLLKNITPENFVDLNKKQKKNFFGLL